MARKTASAEVLVILATFIVSTWSAGLDSTLVDGAHGEDVVNAVVNKIRSRCIFSDDRLFLRRSAFVVSHDGDDPSTNRPDYNGGIWQIGEGMFQETKICSSIYIGSHCNNIRTEFGITWSSVTWSDLRKPLYSGLAATLYTLLMLRGKPMPGSFTEQAQIWASIYQLSADIFITRAPNAAEKTCSDKMDLVFILDSSSSVSYSDFALMSAFAAEVVDVMDVGPNSVRVASIVYSDYAEIDFDLQQYTSKEDIKAAFNATQKLDQGTATDLALDKAASLLYDPSKEARQGVKKVAVLVTDGQSDSLQRTNASATYLKNKGTTVVAVGVGNYNLVELQAVASKPTCANIFTLPNFAVIRSILYEIQKSSCEASIVVPPGTILQGIITDPPTWTPIQIMPGGNESDIKIVVACGILDIYVSFTDLNPGPAIYDERHMATDDSPAILATSQTLPEGAIMYITIIGTRIPETAAKMRNCTEYKWSMSVQPKKDVTVVCEEEGLQRQCTSEDIAHVGLCNGGGEINYNFENPCTPISLERGVMRHQYPYDSTKFLQCDLLGNVYVTACPNGVAFNTDSLECGFTSPPNNPFTARLTQIPEYPCTRSAIAQHHFYFPYAADSTKFIQCDARGTAFLRPCALGTEWSQSDYACVHHRPTVTCTQVEEHFPDPCDHHDYLVCDVSLQPKRVTCGPFLFFNPRNSLCDTTDVQPVGGC